MISPVQSHGSLVDVIIVLVRYAGATLKVHNKGFR